MALVYRHHLRPHAISLDSDCGSGMHYWLNTIIGARSRTARELFSNRTYGCARAHRIAVVITLAIILHALSYFQRRLATNCCSKLLAFIMQLAPLSSVNSRFLLRNSICVTPRAYKIQEKYKFIIENYV